MDNDYNVDIRELCTTIATSDVLVIRFITLSQRLLLDFRLTDIDGPLVRVVEPVKSVDERYRSLQKLRPRLPQPERIVAALWPRFAASITATPAWDEVMRRVADAGFPEAVRAAEEALSELVALERAEQRNAITGEGYRTLWSAYAAPR